MCVRCGEFARAERVYTVATPKTLIHTLRVCNFVSDYVGGGRVRVEAILVRRCDLRGFPQRNAAAALEWCVVFGCQGARTVVPRNPVLCSVPTAGAVTARRRLVPSVGKCGVNTCVCVLPYVMGSFISGSYGPHGMTRYDESAAYFREIITHRAFWQRFSGATKRTQCPFGQRILRHRRCRFM